MTDEQGKFKPISEVQIYMQESQESFWEKRGDKKEFISKEGKFKIPEERQQALKLINKKISILKLPESKNHSIVVDQDEITSKFLKDQSP